MQHLHSFKQYLNEQIKAEEAYQDQDALQTVIDGKRNLGFITLKTSPLDADEFWNSIEKHGLKTIEVIGNMFDAYIYFLPTPEAEAQAWELKSIAEKYGGYLKYDASYEDSERIGQLLGYFPEDITWYLRKNYPERF